MSLEEAKRRNAENEKLAAVLQERMGALERMLAAPSSALCAGSIEEGTKATLLQGLATLRALLVAEQEQNQKTKEANALLVKENDKLKYRVAHLVRELSTEQGLTASLKAGGVVPAAAAVAKPKAKPKAKAKAVAKTTATPAPGDAAAGAGAGADPAAPKKPVKKVVRPKSAAKKPAAKPAAVPNSHATAVAPAADS